MLSFNLPSMFTFKISPDSQRLKYGECLHFLTQTFLSKYFFIPAIFLYLRWSEWNYSLESNQQKKNTEEQYNQLQKIPLVYFY